MSTPDFVIAVRRDLQRLKDIAERLDKHEHLHETSKDITTTTKRIERALWGVLNP